MVLPCCEYVRFFAAASKSSSGGVGGNSRFFPQVQGGEGGGGTVRSSAWLSSVIWSSVLASSSSSVQLCLRVHDAAADPRMGVNPLKVRLIIRLRLLICIILFYLIFIVKSQPVNWSTIQFLRLLAKSHSTYASNFPFIYILKMRQRMGVNPLKVRIFIRLREHSYKTSDFWAGR